MLAPVVVAFVFVVVALVVVFALVWLVKTLFKGK